MSQNTSPRARGQPYQKPARVTDNIPTTGRLSISSLHYDVTVQDLIKIFGVYGPLVRDPHIKYDRSGRSTGFAIVEFTTMGDAANAKNQLNGAKAKGQEIYIRFDTVIHRPRRAVGDQADRGSSLANRIAKAPLIHRLGGGKSTDVDTSGQSSSGPGPVRNHRSVSGGYPQRDRGSRAPRARPQPKSADDLDKELEAFMQDKREDGSKSAGTLAEEDTSMAA